MLAEIRVHVPEAVWNVVFAVAIVGAVVALLAVAGGGRRRRSRRGGGYRVRVGPGLPVVLAAALARRADTLILLCASVAFVLLVVANAGA